MAAEVEIDVYDEEIPRIEAALRKLNTLRKRLSFAEFERAAVEAFAEIRTVPNGGTFRVTCLWDIGGDVPVTSDALDIAMFSIPGLPVPEPVIKIVGRDGGSVEFDHDRQAWAVQHDILNIDPHGPGMITNSGIATPPKQTSMPGLATKEQ